MNMENKITFDITIKDVHQLDKVAMHTPAEKDSITLSNGTTFKIIGYSHHLTSDSIMYSVLVTKPDGMEFKVSFQNVSIFLSEYLLAHAVYELHDLVPMKCPECKHNL